eukprot:516978-Pleurochrysis_carterae.AAC.2
MHFILGSTRHSHLAQLPSGADSNLYATGAMRLVSAFTIEQERLVLLAPACGGHVLATHIASARAALRRSRSLRGHLRVSAR